jgi:hypothetical protein
LTAALQSAIFFETPEQLYARVFKQLKPRAVPPPIEVEFRPFANANSFVRLDPGAIRVRISDVLHAAPAPVMEALAFILLSKLFGKRIPAEYSHRYRRYLNRKEVRARLEQLRQERGRKQITSAAGSAYDLEAIFEDLNLRYFFGLMSRPVIGWSPRASRVTLGHYDPSHNTIVISRLLDRAQVPRLCVEYVMYHEMLHLRYPAEHTGSRRCVHTAEFRSAEKRFVGLKDAKAMLKAL